MFPTGEHNVVWVKLSNHLQQEIKPLLFLLDGEKLHWQIKVHMDKGATVGYLPPKACFITKSMVPADSSCSSQTQRELSM